MSRIRKTKKTTSAFLLSGALVLSCVLSFFWLAPNRATAEETIHSDVSVTVPISCSMSSTLDSAHSATINPNTYQEDIGKTTFKVFCNDNAGYALYAIGYGNEEYGNTNLLPTDSTNPSIATGLAISGNASAWAMKLTPVTTESSGTTQPYVPTVGSAPNEPGGTPASFANYHIVPEEYTKVATFASATDFTIGSSLTSTYRVFVHGLQPADTYAGKVKYTLVHPNDANPPKPEIPESQTATLDIGPTVREKWARYSYGEIQLSDTLPANFTPTEANTISVNGSPNPVYVYDCGPACVYTEAKKIYLNSDSSELFYFVNSECLFHDNFLSILDTSRVTNMSNMFRGCYDAPDDDYMGYDINILANWDTSSVIDMSYMFNSEEGGRGGISSFAPFASWDVSNVTNMYCMFGCDHYGASSVTDVSPLAGWDTSNVTDMESMFYEIGNMVDTYVPLSNWDVSNVTNMSMLFGRYGIPQSKWPSWYHGE